MRKLAYYLENPFHNRNISLAELVAFTTDHLQRMSANNAGGELTARITATRNALTQVGDSMSDDQSSLGIRKARKQTKQDFRARTLSRQIARIEAGIVSSLGTDSGVLVEALPQGRNILRTCRDDQVKGHLQTLVQAVTTHQASLPVATVTQASSLLSQWLTVYEASEASSASKASMEAQRRDACENLQRMLFLNLIKLMELFPHQPEKLPLYMMQHLLENPSAPKNKPPSP